MTTLQKLTDEVSSLETKLKQEIDKNKQLKASYLGLRGFIDSAIDNIWILDSGLNVVDMNKKASQLLGQCKDELIGQNIENIAPSIKETGRYNRYLNVIKTGEPLTEEDVVSPERGGKHYSVKSFKVGEGLGIISTDITDRKKLENQLKESENKFRTLVENSPYFFTILDLEGKIQYINNVTPEYTLEEIIDSPLKLFIHSESIGLYQEKLDKAIKVKKLQTCEVKSSRRDAVLSCLFVPIIKKGKVTEVMAIADDITKRVKSEQNLRESENRFRTLVENSPNYIQIIANDGTVQYMNRVRPEYDHDKVIGSNIFSYFDETNVKTFRSAVEQVFSENKPRNLEIEYINGNSYICDIIPINAKISFVIAVDITERKKMEDALKDSEELHRITLGSISDAVFITDDVGSFTFICPNVNVIFGYNHHEVERLGNIKELIGDEHFNKNKLKSLGEITNIEISIQDKQGNTHVLLMNVKDISIKEGTTLYTCRDITQRKEMEKIIIQSQKLEAVGKLAGGISHEYNNLLTIIMGQSELLLQEINPEDHNNRKIAEEILKASERSSHLTRTLLTFTKQDYVHARVIDVGNAIKEIQPLITSLVKDRVKLVIDVDTSFSAKNPIFIDKRQLEQIILNLSINAYESMGDGGVLTISINESDDVNEYINIDIIDSGTGIDDDTLSKIFDPFFTTKDTGVGLGLYISKEIVESYKGEIKVQSSSGKGSTVRICLPITQKSESLEQVRKKSPEIKLKPMTILLVDDEEEIIKLLERRLRVDGHNVLTGSNGLEAKKIIESYSEKIDLLITDIVMPIMNGIELISSMKEKLIETKILLISGFAKEKVLTEDVSKIPFLVKPFSYKTLIETISEVIDEN